MKKVLLFIGASLLFFSPLWGQEKLKPGEKKGEKVEKGKEKESTSPKKYKIRRYQPQVGDHYRVKKMRKMTRTIEFGRHPRTMTIRKVNFVYDQKILAVKDGQVTKLRRFYREAKGVEIVFQSGRKKAQKAMGLTLRKEAVIVEKAKKGGYEFYKEGKNDLSQLEKLLLKREFESRGKSAGKKKRMLPQVEVAPGESWELPLADIVRTFRYSKGVFSSEGAKARGKLTRVIHKKGAPYGDIEVKVRLKLQNFPQFKDGKGKVNMDFDSHLALDGSVPYGRSQHLTELNVKGEIKGKKGYVPAQLEVVIEEKESREPLKKDSPPGKAEKDKDKNKEERKGEKEEKRKVY